MPALDRLAVDARRIRGRLLRLLPALDMHLRAEPDSVIHRLARRGRDSDSTEDVILADVGKVGGGQFEQQEPLLVVVVGEGDGPVPGARPPDSDNAT